MARSIQDVMTADPVSLSATSTVVEAAQAMRDSDIGDVIVIDESDRVCGIVTDRDITVKAVAEERADAKLGDICDRELHALSPNDSIGDAVKLMSEKAVRRLPVIEDGKPVGIVSLGDLAESEDPDSSLADISAAPPNN